MYTFKYFSTEIFGNGNLAKVSIIFLIFYYLKPCKGRYSEIDCTEMRALLKDYIRMDVKQIGGIRQRKR